MLWSRSKKSKPARAKKKPASRARPKPKPKPRPKAKAKPKATRPSKATKPIRPAKATKASQAAAARTAAKKPAPAPPAAPIAKGKTVAGKPVAGKAAAGKTAPGKAAPGKTGASGSTAEGRPAAPSRPPGRKSSRRSALALRRGPNGELLQPGDLLLPSGPLNGDEILYLLRGAVAGEHPSVDVAVNEVVVKRNTADTERPEVARVAEQLRQRFETSIEPLLPTRAQIRRNFQGVVERARHRRREIGAFLRGLDLGLTESSHMDSHGEDSLQKLMEWSARLERLADADEPEQADYGQFHRVLDQLESNTEALIVDVEATLRRLRDRGRAS